MSLYQTTNHFIEVAVERLRHRVNCDQPVWVDLTGGFDSRMIVGLLAAGEIPFIANTNGADHDQDVELASRVAAAGGYPWRQFDLPAGWSLTPGMLDAALGWGDGTLDVLQLGTVLSRHDEKARTGRVLVTGGGGEHASSFPWLQALPRAGRLRPADIDAAIRHRYLKNIDTGVLRRDPTADVNDYLRTHLSERARLYAHEPDTVQLDAVYAYKSVGHFGAYRAAAEALLRQEMPCYYRDIFTVTFSARHSWRNGHRLQRSIIERLDPRIAAVPTTSGGTAEPITLRNSRQVVPYYMQFAKSALRRLPHPLRAASGSGIASDAYSRAIKGLRAEGVLEVSTMRTSELYDRDKLAEFLSRAGQPDFPGHAMAGRIATVELAARAAA